MMAAGASKKIKLYRNRLQGVPDDHLNNMIELQCCMAKFLTADSWAISAALSHHEIYDCGIDGISYPDAQRGISNNYALSPNFAEKLELCGIWECIVPAAGKDIEIPRFGSLSHGYLEWSVLETKADVEKIHPLTILKESMGSKWGDRILHNQGAQLP